MQNDHIIVLAWPEGMTSSADSWYDYFFAKNGKYRVGHSAIILVREKDKKCRFFDFGRYHTPRGTGRVRDIDTDPDLNIKTEAEIIDKKIFNIKEILKELYINRSTYGKGKMYASVINKTNFKKGYCFAKKIQKKGLINYGPFIHNGTNCSRFVSAVIRKSNPSIITQIRLKYPFCISPSPKRNISISNDTYFIVSKDLNIKIVKKSLFKSYITSIEQCH